MTMNDILNLALIISTIIIAVTTGGLLGSWQGKKEGRKIAKEFSSLISNCSIKNGFLCLRRNDLTEEVSKSVDKNVCDAYILDYTVVFIFKPEKFQYVLLYIIELYKGSKMNKKMD